MRKIIERTAPSPTGNLHLGHVFSALTAYSHAKKYGGQFKLRIEDIDFTRCKIQFENQIISDLKWLGIDWNGKILKQRYRSKYYVKALDELRSLGLIYPCSCTRKDIFEAISAPHKTCGNNLTYPGTCRKRVPKGKITSLRLDIKKAIYHIKANELFFYDIGQGQKNKNEKHIISADEFINKFGDFVVARSDIGTSYHLSVVIDDAAQNVSHVTRGLDLFDVTPIQILLQKLFNIKSPIYHHHKLLLETDGKKLSKRSGSTSVVNLKESGLSAEEVKFLALQHS